MSSKRKHTSDGRGKNPNSLKNLIPYEKGVSGKPGGNPYPVSRHLKDLLCNEQNGRAVAKTMLLTANLPNSKGYGVALKQLMDYTEPAPIRQPEQGTRIINIFVGTDKAKQMVEGMTGRLLQQDNERETKPPGE